MGRKPAPALFFFFFLYVTHLTPSRDPDWEGIFKSVRLKGRAGRAVRSVGRRRQQRAVTAVRRSTDVYICLLLCLILLYLMPIKHRIVVACRRAFDGHIANSEIAFRRKSFKTMLDGTQLYFLSYL